MNALIYSSSHCDEKECSVLTVVYSSTANMKIIDKFMLRSMLCSSLVEQEWWTRDWGIPTQGTGE
jgi:hypothetical protein